MTAQDVKDKLQMVADPARAKNSALFFKTGPGQYGEGDVFIGITVPEQRKITAAFKDLPIAEVKKLLQSSIHEHRLTSLLILVDQYGRADEDGRKKLASFYIANREQINNWDLVDSSAPYIYGDYVRRYGTLADLKQLATAKSLWDWRIAVVSTFAFLKAGELEPTLEIAKILLHDKHDLLHKAVGWALREMGKKNETTLCAFLDEHAHEMPRTMLRYALERLAPVQKIHYMRLKPLKT